MRFSQLMDFVLMRKKAAISDSVVPEKFEPPRLHKHEGESGVDRIMRHTKAKAAARAQREAKREKLARRKYKPVSRKKLRQLMWRNHAALTRAALKEGRQ